MSGGDVYVSFGGDTAGLEAAMAVAKAEVSALGKEMRTLASEMQKAGASADSDLGRKLTALGAQFAEAKGHVTSLKNELRNTGAEGGLLESLRGGLAGALGPMMQMREALGGIAELLAATFAVEKIGEFAESMARLGFETEKTAEILGIAPQKVAAIGVMAQAAGIDQESLGLAFSRLSRNIVDQSPNAKRALDALGLSFKSLSGKDAEAQFAILGEKFSQIADGSTKLAIGTELFGRSFANLLPLLNEGGEGMEQFREIAARAGTSLSGEMLGAMHQTHMELIEFSEALKGAGVATFGEFRGAIDGAYQIMIDLVESFTSAIKSGGMMKDVVDLIAGALKGIETVIAAAIFNFKELWSIGTTAADSVYLAFLHLGRAIGDIFTTLSSGIGAFFNGIIEAGSATARAVGQSFSDLGAVISGAFTGNAGVAFEKLKSDMTSGAADVGKAFQGSMKGFDFSGVSREMDGFLGDEKKRLAQAGEEDIANQQSYAKEYAKIWEGAAAAKADSETKRDAKMAPSGKGKSHHGENDALRTALSALDEEVKAYGDAEKQKEKLLDDELKHKQISIGQWLAMTKDAIDDAYNDEMGAYQKELAIDGLKLAQRQAILNKMADIQRKHDSDIVNAEQKAADDVQKQWEKVSNSVSTAFSGQVSGLLKGTETFGQAFKNILGGLVTQFIESCVKMGVQWILTNTGMQAAFSSMQAALTGIGASGAAAQSAAQKPGIAASITADVGEAYAGFTAFLAPVLGPAAPAAAAGLAASTQATATGLAAFDIGSWQLNSTGAALVHQGEMIVPKSHTPWAQSLMANAAGGGGQGGGGDTHHHWNVVANDAPSFIQMIRNNGHEITQHISSMMGSNPSLRPNF